MTIKKDVQETIEETIGKLKLQRDELNLQMHLASMEVRDEWEQLERKWEHFIGKTEHFRKEVEPSVDDVHIALSLLADEIKDGYKKIKKAL